MGSKNGVNSIFSNSIPWVKIMLKNFKKNNLVMVLICLGLVLGFYSFQVNQVKASPRTCQNHNVFGWAWSGISQATSSLEGIGWISFSCRNTMNEGEGIDYGVDIDRDTGLFSGYAWSGGVAAAGSASGTIGWISFSTSSLVGCPTSPCEARVNLTNYQVSGWARACSVFQSGCGGATSTNTGGWDGWIKLRGITQNNKPYGVSIDTNFDPAASFHGWAWGSDVIGWISFNHLNCDTDGDGTMEIGEGVVGCPPVGTSIPDYKVLTTFSSNRPPEKPKIPSAYPDGESWNHCGIQGLSIPTFHWTYNDQDKDDQATSQVKVYGETTLDTGELSCLPTCTSYSPPSEWIRNNLNWDKIYSWQVRVQDNRGAWSEWSELNSFRMPLHPYPYVNFSHSPQNPAVGEIVTFTDNSICYKTSPTGISCSELAAGTSYDWDFGANASPATSNVKGNATTTYTSSGKPIVTLKITDDVGFCPIPKTLDIQLPLPGYKEVPPVSWLKNFFANILESFKNFSRVSL